MTVEASQTGKEEELIFSKDQREFEDDQHTSGHLETTEPKQFLKDIEKKNTIS